jgi:ABC-type sulfate transport system permease component
VIDPTTGVRVVGAYHGIVVVLFVVDVLVVVVEVEVVVEEVEVVEDTLGRMAGARTEKS